MTAWQLAKSEDAVATANSKVHTMPTNSQSATCAPIQANPYLWSDDTSKHCNARLNFDIPDALLAEVDFKWLMSGQGYRVDPKRFYAEQAYTMDLLQLGLHSESPAVHVCAAYLLEKIERASTVDRPHANDRDFAFNDRESICTRRSPS